MLVSDEWIEKHKHDLDDWVPKIEISRPGSRQTITIKNKEAEREVIKIMRENKRENKKKKGES